MFLGKEMYDKFNFNIKKITKDYGWIIKRTEKTAKRTQRFAMSHTSTNFAYTND
jgi:hypothetical protein